MLSSSMISSMILYVQTFTYPLTKADAVFQNMCIAIMLIALRVCCGLHEK